LKEILKTGCIETNPQLLFELFYHGSLSHGALSVSSASSSLARMSGSHTAIVVNNATIMRRITALGIDLRNGMNNYLDDICNTGRYKYDYGSGVVILKLGPGSSPGYNWNDKSTKQYKIIYQKGGVYLYCHRLQMDPQLLEVVNIYEVDGINKAAERDAYDSALKIEATAARSFNFGHGRSCLETFDHDGATYKRHDLSITTQAILDDAEILIPHEIFSNNN
jgi:hypothetical protein